MISISIKPKVTCVWMDETFSHTTHGLHKVKLDWDFVIESSTKQKKLPNKKKTSTVKKLKSNK